MAGAIGITLALGIASGALVYSTLRVRYQRDINRIVFNRNWELLDDVSRKAGTVADSLQSDARHGAGQPATKPYIVVSIEDRRLWYKFGDTTLYTTQVAVGSGKTLVQKPARGRSSSSTRRAAGWWCRARKWTPCGFRPTGTTWSRPRRKGSASCRSTGRRRFRPATER